MAKTIYHRITYPIKKTIHSVVMGGVALFKGFNIRLIISKFFISPSIKLYQSISDLFSLVIPKMVSTITFSFEQTLNLAQTVNKTIMDITLSIYLYFEHNLKIKKMVISLIISLFTMITTSLLIRKIIMSIYPSIGDYILLSYWDTYISGSVPLDEIDSYYLDDLIEVV